MRTYENLLLFIIIIKNMFDEILFSKTPVNMFINSVFDLINNGEIFRLIIRFSTESG